MMIELSNHLAEGTSDIPLDPTAYGNTTLLRLLPFNSRLRGHCSSMRAGSARNAGRT